MNDFIYDIPVKVYFGVNQLVHLRDELKKLGKKILLVYGGGSIKRTGLYDRVIKEINEAGGQLFELSGVDPNPRIETVREGAELCKKEHIDLLLAVGGGSTIDAAKYIAAGACVDFDPWRFLGEFAPVENALPIITVLTHAATGSEMDCGGVVTNPETNEKIGRMARPMLPRVSFLNPENTFTVNAYQTACGAADILSHIMESYFSLQPGFDMLDYFMEGMMKTIIKYAPVALSDPCNYEARANIMWTASWAINGFIDNGRQRAWSCHAIEHELSAFYDITHGLGLAIITPRWMQYCLDEARVSKYYQFGTRVFEIDSSLPPMEVAEKSIELLSEFLFQKLQLKSTLTSIGIPDDFFPQMARKACRNDAIYGFKTLYPKDVENIYRMSL